MQRILQRQYLQANKPTPPFPHLSYQSNKRHTHADTQHAAPSCSDQSRDLTMRIDSFSEYISKKYRRTQSKKNVYTTLINVQLA
jgi:hypothetical protein